MEDELYRCKARNSPRPKVAAVFLLLALVLVCLASFPVATAMMTWLTVGKGGMDSSSGSANLTAPLATVTLATAPLTAKMIVSYSVVSGGTPNAPTFHYMSDNAPVTYSLTTTPTALTVDEGSDWSVTPNPLSGSSSPSTEQWYADPAKLNGKASDGEYVFSFQHQYLLTLIATASGIVSPLPEGQSASGSVAITATSSSGYSFTIRTGYGIGVNPLSEWQNASDTVTIAATADSGYSLSRWTGYGIGSFTGTTNPTSVTMSESIAETGIFAQSTYNLTVTVVGSGVVNRNNTGPYHLGDVVQLTAAPNTGWVFSSWRGDLSDSTNTTSITITSDQHMTAIFAQIQYTSLVVNTSPPGLGSPKGSGTYGLEATVTISVSAVPGYTFQKWQKDGIDYSALMSFTYTVDGSHTFTAVFQKDPSQYAVTVNTSPSGLGSTKGTGVYSRGTVVTISVSSVSGYTFQQWNRDGQYYTGAMSFPYSVDVSHTFTAVFKVAASPAGASVTIASTPLGSGFVVVDGAAIETPHAFSWDAGSVHTLAANSFVSEANGTHYAWVGWSDEKAQTHAIIMPSTGSITYTANFALATSTTMTVEYLIAGAGSRYASPTIACVLNKTSVQYELNWTTTSIQCDINSVWSITNPLPGSSSSERWFSSQPQKGTVAFGQTIQLTFQHQYYLITQTNPAMVGSVAPNRGWRNAWATVTLTPLPPAGYFFSSWTGSGEGSYTGTTSSTTITMYAPITETVNFSQNPPGSAASQGGGSTGIAVAGAIGLIAIIGALVLGSAFIGAIPGAALGARPGHSPRYSRCRYCRKTIRTDSAHCPWCRRRLR